MAKEKLVHLTCLICDEPLSKKQKAGRRKYCGYTCSGIGRTKVVDAPECHLKGCTNRVGKSKHNNSHIKWRIYCSRECFNKGGKVRKKSTCSRGHEKVFDKVVYGTFGSYDRTVCPRCRTANRYARMLDITIEEALNLKVPEVCEICKEAPPEALRLDHNHKTLELRGFLCGPCNSGLGYFKDNPKNIRAAFYYLKERGYYG